MREILFRGKKTGTDEWVEGSLYIEYGETTKDGNRVIDYRILGMRGECDYVDPATVGQCTGVKDRTGKWIFEGDLVKYHDRIFGDVVAEIIYSETGACFCARYVKRRNNQPALDIVMNESEIEIIGNIHFNPELLEIDVNKERLTQALTDARKFYDEGYRSGKLDAGPKWISVKDKLPERNKRVLVAFKDGMVTTSMRTLEQHTGVFGFLFEGDYGTATHWMPLPEPPKEG